jgi:uncharacterized protein (DUF1330 family)
MEQLAATSPPKENSRAGRKRPQPQQTRNFPLQFFNASTFNRAMPAYIIVEIDIIDPIGYEEYKKLAGASVEKYGGKYVMRGGKTEVLEGDWQPKRIVVVEFESAQRAKEWLNCEEYREPRKMRHRTARTNMILVEGV